MDDTVKEAGICTAVPGTSGEVIAKVKNCITTYKVRDVAPAVREALDAGADPQKILDDGMIAAMAQVGEGFKNNTVFMPQMLIAAKGMQAGLEVLKPYLKGDGSAPSRGKAIIGSVMGDVHDIGKNLVSIMLEGIGMEVKDLGADVPPEKFIEAINSTDDLKVVACSCSMTPNREALAQTVADVNALPNRQDLTVMVGGATMDQEFCDKIGADIYTAEAASASERAKQITDGMDKKAVYEDSRRVALEALAEMNAAIQSPGEGAEAETFHRHSMEAPFRTARLEAGAGFCHDRLSMKDNVRETLKHEKGQPDRFVPQYDFFKVFFYDPILGNGNAYFYSKGKEIYTDGWGITHTCPPGAISSHPAHGPGLTKIPDVTKWQEYITVPPTKYSDADWEKAVQWGKDVKANDDMFCAMMVLTGIFERTHFLLGMQEALADFFEHPEEMHELINTITDWEVDYVKEFCSRVEPEVIFHHDDWGTALNSFLPPDVHREFFYEPYKRVYDTFREMGGEIVIHHSDSWAANLVPIQIDLGIDIWQGPISANNIPNLIDEYGDKICFMGGLDNAAIDLPDWTGDGVRKYVEEKISENGPISYIPCLTRGLGFSIVPEVYPFVSKTINELSAKYF